MLNRFEISDGDVFGIVDLNHVPGESDAVNNDICPVENDILPVIDPEQAVIPGIRNGIRPGIENDPGITGNVQVIFDVHVGLGEEHRA
jgi:hypothetical protein